MFHKVNIFYPPNYKLCYKRPSCQRISWILKSAWPQIYLSELWKKFYFLKVYSHSAHPSRCQHDSVSCGTTSLAERDYCLFARPTLHKRLPGGNRVTNLRRTNFALTMFTRKLNVTLLVDIFEGIIKFHKADDNLVRCNFSPNEFPGFLNGETWTKPGKKCFKRKKQRKKIFIALVTSNFLLAG